jgi:hypothetical protein
MVSAGKLLTVRETTGSTLVVLFSFVQAANNKKAENV